ncbi:MAG: autotransporter outer membrane beta-barrel domain-containing protein, partial [Akkermansia sp.]
LNNTAPSVATGTLISVSGNGVSLKLTGDALEQLEAGAYTLVTVGDSEASEELSLDDETWQSIYRQGYTGSFDLCSPDTSVFSLRAGTALPDAYILSVAEMSDAQSTWVVGNTTLGADADSQVPMRVLDENGHLVSEDILDNVRFVKVNGSLDNNVIDLSGDHAAWDIQLNQVIGQGGLRLVGDAEDTIRFTTADSFTGVVSVQGAQSAFRTGSGTTLLLRDPEQGQPQVLSDASSMTGGALGVVLTQQAIAGGDVQVTTGAALTLNGTSVHFSEQAEAGVSTWDVDADATLTIRLGDAGSSATNVTVFFAEGSLLNKYFRANGVGSDGTIHAVRNASYYSSTLHGTGAGAVGLALADEALLKANVQHTDPTGDLARVLDTLDAYAANGDRAAANRLGAALSGSSVAAMGAALGNDVERQLRAIRNRTTTMGVNQCVVNEDMPYFNAWVNAEGDYRKQSADDTLAGYKLSSWGGTVGFDADCTPSFTCGLAFSALYGDFDAESTDNATGDLNTYYLSAFARYTKHRWTHTFVATAGLADTSLKRTVDGATVKGDSDGSMLGALYELGYVFALDEEATTCLQPIFNVAVMHSSLSGYTEKDSDLALKVDDTELTRVSFGLGARLQAVVGENVYNRSSILELRALLKLDAGDRKGSTDVSLAALQGAGTHSVRSAESGVVGGEFGAGLTVPVGDEGGNIFADASVELRADYTNVNAVLGYRVNF